MNQIGEKIFNLGTYGIASAAIAVDFESIKSVVLFAGAMFLLILQIKIHLIKLKKEKKNDSPE